MHRLLSSQSFCASHGPSRRVVVVGSVVVVLVDVSATHVVGGPVVVVVVVDSTGQVTVVVVTVGVVVVVLVVAISVVVVCPMARPLTQERRINADAGSTNELKRRGREASILARRTAATVVCARHMP
jgi:hypothetical protein